MDQRHVGFEWGADKARRNLDKHRVSFPDAALALRDGTVRTRRDLRDHGGEVRWNSLARHPRTEVLLMVTWTVRGQWTRIISARAANRKERRHE